MNCSRPRRPETVPRSPVALSPARRWQPGAQQSSLRIQMTERSHANDCVRAPIVYTDDAPFISNILSESTPTISVSSTVTISVACSRSRCHVQFTANHRQPSSHQTTATFPRKSLRLTCWFAAARRSAKLLTRPPNSSKSPSTCASNTKSLRHCRAPRDKPLPPSQTNPCRFPRHYLLRRPAPEQVELHVHPHRTGGGSGRPFSHSAPPHAAHRVLKN